MKLIAVHEIHRRADGKPVVVSPKSTFEADDKEAAELIALGAVLAVVDQVAEPVAQTARPKPKKAKVPTPAKPAEAPEPVATEPEATDIDMI